MKLKRIYNKWYFKSKLLNSNLKFNFDYDDKKLKFIILILEIKIYHLIMRAT